MLNVKNLFFKYNQKSVLENISFSVDQSKLVYLIGDNGVGKTTLLRVLAGHLDYEKGKIFIDNKLVDDFAPFFYLGHSIYFHSKLRLNENIKFILNLYGYNLSLQLINSRLEYFGLFKVRNSYLSNLSQGQKRKSSLTLLHYFSKKKIWLLDEPFINLDSDSKKNLVVLINKFLSNGGIVIMATHEQFPIEGKKIVIKNSHV
tara:strand:- start:1310 stop:1915 length:606 start_codon:yes stop_codon:yes gene_type:complete